MGNILDDGRPIVSIFISMSYIRSKEIMNKIIVFFHERRDSIEIPKKDFLVIKDGDREMRCQL